MLSESRVLQRLVTELGDLGVLFFPDGLLWSGNEVPSKGSITLCYRGHSFKNQRKKEVVEDVVEEEE